MVGDWGGENVLEACGYCCDNCVLNVSLSPSYYEITRFVTSLSPSFNCLL